MLELGEGSQAALITAAPAPTRAPGKKWVLISAPLELTRLLAAGVLRNSRPLLVFSMFGVALLCLKRGKKRRL